jgi:hypothetical protein
MKKHWQNFRPRGKRKSKLQIKKEEIGKIADQEGGDRSNCRPRRRRLAKLQTK